MSIAHSPESATLQTQFAEKLGEVQEWLQDRSIPYTVIGSVATAAHLTPEGSEILNFDRPYATSPQDRIPDIDLIVPRDSLAPVRKYRDSQLSSDFPVSIGLGFPSRFVDFRADKPISYLTSGHSTFPVDTETLLPETKTVLDVEVLVPNPRTLYHIHHMVGVMRNKDVANVARLAELSENDRGDYENYIRMTKHRKHHPGMISRVGRAQKRITEGHPSLAKRVHKVAQPVASLLGAR